MRMKKLTREPSKTNKADSHPPILYGHVHVAKTGGTSLNGIFANTFERVCGQKGYSYDAFQDNERAKMKVKKGQNIRSEGRSRVFLPIMQEIGLRLSLGYCFMGQRTSHCLTLTFSSGACMPGLIVLGWSN